MKQNFNPYSENLIFFDTEFSSNNPNEGEIISLAMIKMDGSELYLELEFDGEVHNWVKSNVLPFLTGKKVNKEDAKKKILEFIGDHPRSEKPFLVTYVNQFYFVYFMKIFDYYNSPFQPIPIDFASILFALGINPDEYKQRLDHKLMSDLKIDISKYRIHHALDDARLLKEVFIRLQEGSKDK